MTGIFTPAYSVSKTTGSDGPSAPRRHALHLLGGAEPPLPAGQRGGRQAEQLCPRQAGLVGEDRTVRPTTATTSGARQARLRVLAAISVARRRQ